MTQTDQRPPRRMLQPVKDELRRQLEVERARVAYLLGMPWWRRLFAPRLP